MKIIVLNHSEEEVELLKLLLHSAFADKNSENRFGVCNVKTVAF